MKNLTFILVILLAAFVFSSCQETANTNSKTNETNTSSAGENKSADNASKPAESLKAEEEKPTSNLKPEDIDLEKPIPAEELNTAFLANEKAWIGKEVSIIGKYHSTTKSRVMDEDRIRVDISDAKTNKKMAGCIVKKEVPEELSKERENRVFKGKIAENRYGRILIEPCEFVK